MSDLVSYLLEIKQTVSLKYMHHLHVNSDDSTSFCRWHWYLASGSVLSSYRLVITSSERGCLRLHWYWGLSIHSRWIKIIFSEFRASRAPKNGTHSLPVVLISRLYWMMSFFQGSKDVVINGENFVARIDPSEFKFFVKRSTRPWVQLYIHGNFMLY
jgi:hypothetical protein